MRLHKYAFIGLALSFASAAGAQKHAMTFEDFAAVRNVSDPQISPSGASVLYSVRTTDVAKNSRTSVTYIIPFAGGAPRQFPSALVKAGEARWSPDGKWVAYTAGDQLWVVAADGSGARKVTSLNGGASGPVWSPAGDNEH
jgi:Tol biopolymer transport system component